MTDLGNINVISPAAGQVIDDKRSLQQGIATALSVGKDIAEKAVTEDLLKDLQATEILEGERAVGVPEGIAEPADTPSSVVITPMPGPGEDAEFLAREAEINRIVSAVDQSPNTAHKGRAILEMQKLVAQAKSKHPWAADRLDAAASRYMNTSYRLAELGLVDAASTARANQAQSELSALTAKAEELGIDTILHPVGSPGFINQFNVRSRREAEWERIEAEERTLEHNINLTGRDALGVFSRSIRDASGATAAVQQTILGSYNSIFSEGTRDLMALGPDQLSASEAAQVAKEMEIWNTTGKDQAIQTLLGHKRDVQTRFEKRFLVDGGQLVGTPAYEQALVILEQEKADTDLLIEMANTNSWDLDRVLKARAYFMNSTNMHPKVADLANMTRDPGFATMMKFYEANPTGGAYRALADLTNEEGTVTMVPILRPEAHVAQIHQVELSNIPPSVDAAGQVRLHMSPPAGVGGLYTLPYAADHIDNEAASYTGHRDSARAVALTVEKTPAAFTGGAATEGALWGIFRDLQHMYIQTGQEMENEQFDEVFQIAGSLGVYNLFKVAGNGRNKQAASLVLDNLYSGSTANGKGDTVSRLTSKNVQMANEVSPFVLEVSIDNFEETGQVDVALNGEAVKAYVDANIAAAPTYAGPKPSPDDLLNEGLTKWGQKVAEYQDHTSTLLRLLVNDYRAKGIEPDSTAIANLAESIGLVVQEQR
jgi:hypothetical protein